MIVSTSGLCAVYAQARGTVPRGRRAGAAITD
jgi:hypothetical protein